MGRNLMLVFPAVPIFDHRERHLYTRFSRFVNIILPIGRFCICVRHHDILYFRVCQRLVKGSHGLLVSLPELGSIEKIFTAAHEIIIGAAHPFRSFNKIGKETFPAPAYASEHDQASIFTFEFHAPTLDHRRGRVKKKVLNIFFERIVWKIYPVIVLYLKVICFIGLVNSNKMNLFFVFAGRQVVYN